MKHRGRINSGCDDSISRADELTERYDIDEPHTVGSAVDYVVCSKPNPGSYCLGTHHDPKQRHLELYMLGKGPLYSFHTSYHLEVTITAGRVVLMGDTTVRALRHVDAVTTAKTDLKAGPLLDRGGYDYSGGRRSLTSPARSGCCRLGGLWACEFICDVPKRATLTYDEVFLPGQLVDQLLEAQGRPSAYRSAS